MEKLVFDTSAILNCGKRGECEFLLERLTHGHELFTTPEVQRELCDPRSADYYRMLLKKVFTVQGAREVRVDLGTLRRLTALLGSGELSVILLAMELNAAVVLDEKVARTQAAALKLRVTGTLGLLADGVKKRWCTDQQCLAIVSRLHTNGFRIRRPGMNVTFKEYFASFGA